MKLRASNLIVYHHFFLYAVLIVSNTIIPAAAAWNFSLVPHGHLASLDAYMIFLGAFSLLIVFPIFYLDIFTHSAVTSTVRAECLWTGALLLFYLPGAAASTALLSDLCGSSPSFGVQSPSDACQSSQLLQGFAWTCTIDLLLHCVVLFTSAMIYARRHQHHDRDQKLDAPIWRQPVRRVDWSSVFHFRIRLNFNFFTRIRLRSAPPSPARPRFDFNADIFVAAPQPRRAYAPHSPPPLEERYRIEHLSDTMHMPHKDTGAQGLYPAHIQATAVPIGNNEHTFPPTHDLRPKRRRSRSMSAMSLSRRDRDRRRTSSRSPHRRSPPLLQVELAPAPAPMPDEPYISRPTSQTPSPLGEWPRADIMQNPPLPSPRRAKLAAGESSKRLVPIRPLPTTFASAPEVARASTSSATAAVAAAVPRTSETSESSQPPPRLPEARPAPRISEPGHTPLPPLPRPPPAPIVSTSFERPSALTSAIAAATTASAHEQPQRGPAPPPLASMSRPKRPAGPRSSLDVLVRPSLDDGRRAPTER